MKKYQDPIRRITRTYGEASNIAYKEITQHLLKNKKAYQEVEEEKAIKLASSLAQNEDVIIHIPKEDHAQSMHYIHKHLA